MYWMVMNREEFVQQNETGVLLLFVVVVNTLLQGQSRQALLSLWTGQMGLGQYPFMLNKPSSVAERR